MSYYIKYWDKYDQRWCLSGDAYSLGLPLAPYADINFAHMVLSTLHQRIGNTLQYAVVDRKDAQLPPPSIKQL